jgi:hypothetical protein
MSILQNFPEEGPTLNLNFAGSRTLDPRITFTRTQTTSNGSSYMDKNGLIRYAGPDEPRFDHRYVNGEVESLGLLIEEQRTNSISNNTMIGAVVGTPGVSPTDWGISTTNAELTSSIVEVGVESGISYVDVRVSGTVTASRACDIRQSLLISASNGQIWSHSVYLREVGGSQTNITDIRIQGNVYADTAYLVTPWFRAVPVTTESLITQRRVATATLVGETITQLAPYIKITTASSGVVDFTLRIGMPQLELGSFATSIIPTEGSAKTRNKDNVSMTGTNFSDWYNQSEGTISCSFRAQSSEIKYLMGISNNSAAELIYIRATSTGSDSAMRDGGSDVAYKPIAYSRDIDTLSKHCVSYKQNDFIVSAQGQISTVDDGCTVPTPTNISIGSLYNNSQLGGTISQLTYYPKRLTNTQLQNLTK